MNTISNYGLSLHMCVCVLHKISAQQNANNGRHDDDQEVEAEDWGKRKQTRYLYIVTIAEEEYVYFVKRARTHIATSVDRNSSSSYCDNGGRVRVFFYSSIPFRFHNFPNTFNFICYMWPWLLLLFAPLY